MDIFIIAPKHIRKRMCVNETCIRIIAKKIGADYELKSKEMLYANSQPIVTFNDLYEFPEDTLIYLAPDIPEDCPWKVHMDDSERIVLVVHYAADLLELLPFLRHAQQSNRKVELYFLNKEELQ